MIAYVNGSQFNSGTAFSGTGTNFLYNGTVTFNGSLTSQNLEMAADVKVVGTSTLSGAINWTGGTIGGAMTIAGNGTLYIIGTADRALSGSLNNQGLIIWSGANTILMADGHLTNLAGGVFEIQNNRVLASYSGIPNVNNSGVIRKSSGGGDSTIGVPLINSGTLDVQSGRLGYVGGSQFNSGTTFAGAGTNVVYNGAVTFNGAVSSENLEITSDGTLHITGTADRSLLGSLNNQGLMLWSGANTIYVHNAPITNAAGALFEIQNNQTLNLYNGSPKLHNSGTIRKTAGGGTTIFTVPVPARRSIGNFGLRRR